MFKVFKPTGEMWHNVYFVTETRLGGEYGYMITRGIRTECGRIPYYNIAKIYV